MFVSIQCCMHVREIPNSLPMPLQDGTSRVLVFFGSDCRVGGLDAHIEGLGELQSIFSKCLVVLEHHVYISISPYIYIYIHKYANAIGHPGF